ncbi:MAG: hypothetical protein ACREEL_03580 [Stellaceae bacterium]
MTVEHIIHIEWEGPHALEEIRKKTGPQDKGLYQVYAHHPVYGRNLVYFGKTEGCFADRIPHHGWEGGAENDPNRVEYYLERLKGVATSAADQWNDEIALAEALLIHAHGPAYNSQSVKEPPPEATHGYVRVLNWGAVRSL